MTAKIALAMLATLSLLGCTREEKLIGQIDPPVTKAELAFKGDKGVLEIQYVPGTTFPAIHEEVTVQASTGVYTVTRHDKTKLEFVSAGPTTPTYVCQDCVVFFPNKIPALWKLAN